MALLIRRLVFFSVFTFLSIQADAQLTDARKLLSDSINDCSEIQYASMQLIPLYYQDENIDTANYLLDYWAKKCGTDETIFRTRILWAIDSGTFSDTLFGDEVIQYLDVYQWLYNDTTGNALQSYYYYTPEYELLKWYQSFTDSITSRALNYSDLSAEEAFFVRYYHHPVDSMFLLLTTREYSGTKLKKIFDTPILGELPVWIEHQAGIVGIWIPGDKLSIVGIHPCFGYELGFQKNKMIFNLGAELSIGKSKNKYQVAFNDQIHNSDNFMELSIHADLGRQIIQYRRFEFDVFGSASYEALEVLNLNDGTISNENAQSKFIHSPGLGFGAAYIYYLNKGRYIGIKGRYNLLNFNNSGGTNLRGNALMITTEYGIGMNQWLNKQQTFLNNRIKAFKKK